MKKSIRLFGLTILFGLTLTGWVTAAPAFWKIDGPKGDVYLFGSIRLLPQGVNWRTPELDAALNAAEVVVFELDFDEGQEPAAMRQLIAKYGVLTEGGPLRSLLTDEQREQYERVVASIGVSAANFDPMRPWLVALTLGVQWIVSQGYDPNSSVDQQIWNWGKQNGKVLVRLETAEKQFEAFADLSREQEIEYLAVTLDQIEQQPTLLNDLVNAWREGDTVKLDTLLNAAMADVPALSQRLLRNRNAKWLSKIEGMIADGRPHLIVVGAAHLVGKDSVIAMLRAKGVRVEGP